MISNWFPMFNSCRRDAGWRAAIRKSTSLYAEANNECASTAEPVLEGRDRD